MAITKAENRAAARAYAADKKRRFEEEQERAGRGPDLEALRVIRHYLIFEAKTRGYAHERLKVAIDGYAGEITGDRTALHAKPAGNRPIRIGDGQRERFQRDLKNHHLRTRSKR